MNLNECDFCGAKKPFLYPINDGLWAICKPCMDIHYDILPLSQNRESSAQLRKRTAPPRCSGLSLDCTPDDCYCSPLVEMQAGGEEE